MWKSRRFKKSSGNLRKILPFFFVLSVSVLLFILIKVGLLDIKKVETELNQLGCVDENQLKDSAKLLGQNFFLIDQIKVEESLKKQFFCIKSIMLSKKFPNKVVLQASGRQPFAALVRLKEVEASSSSWLDRISTDSARQISDFYIVDDEGIVFDRNKDSLNIPRIFAYNLELSFGKSLAGNLIASPIKVLEKVKAFGVNTGESWINGDIFIINNSPPQPRIIFRLNERVDVQLASLQLILTEAKINSRELEFIDLRFDKPIVRFAPKKNG